MAQLHPGGRGSPFTGPGTDHQALVGSLPQLSVSRFPAVLIHITFPHSLLPLGPSQAKQIPPETILLSLTSPPPNPAA